METPVSVCLFPAHTEIIPPGSSEATPATV